jgi:hypothetical protein
MAGYSGTPLIRKLGIKPGQVVCVVNPPEAYWDWLSPLPDNLEVVGKPGKEGANFIHLFEQRLSVFEKDFLAFKKGLQKDGMLWVSWPKRASKVATDLDETAIRNFGLKNGLVDVKVCAVDEVWSGLKFVFRLKDR